MKELKRLNLAAPFTARKWLRLLCADAVSGIRLRRNVRAGRSYLGFSFQSNDCGLHGPLDRNGDNVIMGTSFAMGLGVDEEHNWWNLAFQRESGWLNLGLPIGIQRMKPLLESVHRGARRRLLFVYHPNLVTLSKQFERLSMDGVDPFQAFGWKTGYLDCCRLVVRGLIRRLRMRQTGYLVTLPAKLGGHEIDCRYCRCDGVGGAEYASRCFDQLISLFESFDQAYIIRARIKQEVVPDPQKTSRMCEAQRNYDDIWELLRQRTVGRRKVALIEPANFQLEHYHPYDTHWNNRGNDEFARMVDDTLSG